MKEFIKTTVFLQSIVILMYIVLEGFMLYLNQDCCIIILPITMVIVFAVQLLATFVIVPLMEQFFGY